MRAQLWETSPVPLLRTTVGLPLPVQCMCSRCPPTSYSWPGIAMVRLSCASATVSTSPPIEASAKPVITGKTSQRARLVIVRRSCRTIHTLRAKSTGGHTQPALVSPSLPGAMAIKVTPVTPIATAGTRAHRCGCLVKRVVRRASIAQPEAKASRQRPVVVCSRAPGKTSSVRTRALTAPVRRDAITARNMGPAFATSSAASGSCGAISDVVAVMAILLSTIGGGGPTTSGEGIRAMVVLDVALDLAGAVRADQALDEVQGHVDAGGNPGGGDDVAVVDPSGVFLDPDARIECGELGDRAPVSSGCPVVEEASGGVHQAAAADARQQWGGVALLDDPRQVFGVVEQRTGPLAAWVDDDVEQGSVDEAVVRSNREPLGAADVVAVGGQARDGPAVLRVLQCPVRQD